MAMTALADLEPEAPASQTLSPSWAELRWDVITDLDALDALGPQWCALMERCPDSRVGFQSFAWLRAWLVNYADEGIGLHVVVGYFRDRLALIWPLEVKRSFGLKVVEHLGEPLSQYHDAIVDPDAPGDWLLEGALRHLQFLDVDVLRLRRVRDDSRLTPILRAAGARVTRGGHAPYVDFDAGETPETFERALSGKERSNRRRRLRKLEELGAITFESDPAPERARELIRAALAMKRAWALEAGVYAAAAFDPRFEKCFLDAVDSSNPSAHLRVFGICCAGRPIAVEISLGYRGRLFGHVLAHDPALAKMGVGVLLADASIREAYKAGFRLFDLLSPADPYKTFWAKRKIGVNDYLLGYTRRGSAIGLAKAGAPLWLAALVAALLGGGLQPYLFKDLRYL